MELERELRGEPDRLVRLGRITKYLGGRIVVIHYYRTTAIFEHNIFPE